MQNLIQILFVVVSVAVMFFIFTSKKKEKTEDIIPTKQKKRTKCPFYGFYMVPNALMDQDGNQCALENGHTPCSMEMRGKYPDFGKCTFFYSDAGKSEFLSKCESSNVRVFPSEFWPEGKSEWEGILFSKWTEYIF